MDSPTQAPIFDIQRFSIHDGPGIRSLVFFKGCHLRCKWCQNPESQSAVPLIAFYKSRCTESFDCRKVCSESGINEKSFRIDSDKCTVCGKCVEACAFGALELIGEQMTPETLLRRLLVDLLYYKRSGGGVTFSGGEPTLYPDFIDQAVDLCIKHQIHTTIETSGTFSFKVWETILRKVDLIYFDLKIIDSRKHKIATGVSNATIMKNAEMLVKKQFNVEFRMPLVAGYTDSDENILSTIQWLKKMGQNNIHLLRYHNMGEQKIDIIRGSQEKLKLSNYPDLRHDEIVEAFCRESIQPIPL